MSISYAYFSGVREGADTLALPIALPIYFTADWHLGHAGNEPLATARGCDEACWREQVLSEILRLPKDSIVFGLGDLFTFRHGGYPVESREICGAILDQVYLFLLKGNHETLPWDAGWPQRMKILSPLVDLHASEHHFVLCHYPLRQWNRAHHRSIHLHGHTHAGLKGDDGENFYDTAGKERLVMDVSWDATGARILSLHDIIAEMRVARTFVAEHHYALPAKSLLYRDREMATDEGVIA